MTEIDWATIRDRAIEQFDGQTPRAADEEQIINHFEHQPTVVIQAITEIAKATNVTWKWSALAARLDKAEGPPRNPIVQTGTTRTKAIEAADSFMRNSGTHYDRWDEVHDELFGTRGHLHAWKDQTKLVERMKTAWEHVRPTGEQLDAEELERAQRWVAQRKALATKPKAAPATGIPWHRAQVHHYNPETGDVTPTDTTTEIQPVGTELSDPADYDYGNPAGEPT